MSRRRTFRLPQSNDFSRSSANVDCAHAPASMIFVFSKILSRRHLLRCWLATTAFPIFCPTTKSSTLSVRFMGAYNRAVCLSCRCGTTRQFLVSVQTFVPMGCAMFLAAGSLPCRFGNGTQNTTTSASTSPLTQVTEDALQKCFAAGTTQSRLTGSPRSCRKRGSSMRSALTTCYFSPSSSPGDPIPHSNVARMLASGFPGLCRETINNRARVATECADSTPSP